MLLDESDSVAIATLICKRKNVKINKIVKNKGCGMVIFEGPLCALGIIANWFKT